MSWKPILVGVDSSEEAARAAAVGAQIASAAGTECHFVHVSRDLWENPIPGGPAIDTGQFNEAVLDAVGTRIKTQLRRHLPAEEAEHLQIKVGRAASVLVDTAHELGAGLVVLGGKHHGTLARWLGGSTAHHLARRIDVPVLVTGDAPVAIRRILAAVDTSDAASVTIAEAERFAHLFDAPLRVVHVVATLPVVPEYPIAIDQDAILHNAIEHLERSVWPKITLANVDKAVRQGSVVDILADEMNEWRADLVVVGSHGKGLVDRILLGSTTESLLSNLPASLLVVPTSSHQAG